MKRIVYKSTRNSLKEIIPNLSSYNCKCKEEDHWNLLRVVLFSSYRGEENEVRVGAEAIARATNKLNQFKAGRFNAGVVIDHFINDIFPFAQVITDEFGREWSKSTWEQREDGSYKKIADGKQRRLALSLPISLKEVLMNEKVKRNEDRVYLDTGRLVNNKREKEYRDSIYRDCLDDIQILDCKPAEDIATYINNLPTNTFTKLLVNYDKTLNKINSLSSEASQYQQYLVLEAIRECPKPFIRSSDNTDRLFAHGATIAALKKDVRKELTRDWYEADLKSAQLAIVAKVWKVKEVQDFLKEKRSFWKEILTYLNLKEKDKKHIKDYTYGVIFGMSENNILRDLTSIFNQEVSQAFLSHPLIKSLLKARTKYINKLLKDKVMVDAFNKEFKVTKSNVLTMLARQAQSYEMALIYPIFQVAKTTDEFSIVLYQFDGVSIKFHREYRKEYWIEQIKLAVEKIADELDIYTTLEVENNEVKVKKDVLENIILARETSYSGEIFHGYKISNFDRKETSEGRRTSSTSKNTSIQYP